MASGWNQGELELSDFEDPVYVPCDEDEPFTNYGTNRPVDSSEDESMDDEIRPESENILRHLLPRQRLQDLSSYAALNADMDEEKMKVLHDFMDVLAVRINGMNISHTNNDQSGTSNKVPTDKRLGKIEATKIDTLRNCKESFNNTGGEHLKTKTKKDLSDIATSPRNIKEVCVVLETVLINSDNSEETNGTKHGKEDATKTNITNCKESFMNNMGDQHFKTTKKDLSNIATFASNIKEVCEKFETVSTNLEISGTKQNSEDNISKNKQTGVLKTVEGPETSVTSRCLLPVCSVRIEKLNMVSTNHTSAAKSSNDKKTIDSEKSGTNKNRRKNQKRCPKSNGAKNGDDLEQTVERITDNVLPIRNEEIYDGAKCIGETVANKSVSEEKPKNRRNARANGNKFPEANGDCSPPYKLRTRKNLQSISHANNEIKRKSRKKKPVNEKKKGNISGTDDDPEKDSKNQMNLPHTGEGEMNGNKLTAATSKLLKCSEEQKKTDNLNDFNTGIETKVVKKRKLFSTVLFMETINDSQEIHIDNDEPSNITFSKCF